MIEVYMQPTEPWPYPNFTFNELACKDTNSVQYMDGVLPRLQALRHEFGKPMPMSKNGGCRSVATNALVGGAVRSFHLHNAKQFTKLPAACAVDIGTHKMTGGQSMFEWTQEVVARHKWAADRWKQMKASLDEHALGTTEKMHDVHRLVLLAMRHGWTIGVARTFLHLDRRSDYPETGFLEPIVFTYK
jgi:hypothetical protein